MPTVVIIHAAEDTLPARALAEKLRLAKLNVTLEHPPGEELREAVMNAPVTIVLWSPRSVAQPALVEDAQFATSVSDVVHACMQSANVPDEFRGSRSVNLTGWRGEDDFRPWRELGDLVVKKAGAAPLPAAGRVPAGFFQSGYESERGGPRQPSPPRAPQPQPGPRAYPQPPRQPYAPTEPRGGGRGMMIAIIAAAVVVLGGGAFWAMTQNHGGHTASLEDVDLGSAQALRAFIAGNPSDADREQAEEALSSLEQQSLDAARDANTIEAFQQFLHDFPDSDEAIFVQGQIQQLRVQEANPPATDVPPEEAAPPPGENPDLVAPGAATTTPDETEPPDGSGPAVIAPPAEPAPTQPTP